METCSFPLLVSGTDLLIIYLFKLYEFLSVYVLLFNVITLWLQSNALPSHVKINVSRQTLFEDSFQQVSRQKLLCLFIKTAEEQKGAIPSSD